MATNKSGKIALRSREHPTDLKFWQWGATLAQALATTIYLAGKAIKRLSKSSSDGISFYEYIAYQGMRDYQSQLGPVGIQNLLSSTTNTCKRFARKHRLPFSTIALDDGTVVLRIGALNPTRTAVFFHGGGYMAPALSAHIGFAFGFDPMAHQGLAIYVLQYSLVTETANPYPRQLQQAASLLNHLLHTQAISPTSTTLLGDSAGGHLLLGLLLHLRHPHPQVPAVKVNRNFAGAALLSPWLTLYDEPEISPESTTAIDVLDPDALNRWAKSFLAGASPDPWNAPLTAEPSWWDDLPVDSIIVLYGRDEYLASGAKQIAEVLQAHHITTAVHAFGGEVHEHMIMNRFLRLNKECESETVYRAWLDSVSKS